MKLNEITLPAWSNKDPNIGKTALSKRQYKTSKIKLSSEVEIASWEFRDNKVVILIDPKFIELVKKKNAYWSISEIVEHEHEEALIALEEAKKRAKKFKTTIEIEMSMLEDPFKGLKHGRKNIDVHSECVKKMWNKSESWYMKEQDKEMKFLTGR